MVHYVIANLGTKGLSKSNNANENIGYPNIVCIVVGLYKDIAKEIIYGKKTRSIWWEATWFWGNIGTICMSFGQYEILTWNSISMSCDINAKN